jgi:hypothetical protein
MERALQLAKEESDSEDELPEDAQKSDHLSTFNDHLKKAQTINVVPDNFFSFDNTANSSMNQITPSPSKVGSSSSLAQDLLDVFSPPKKELP